MGIVLVFVGIVAVCLLAYFVMEKVDQKAQTK